MKRMLTTLVMLVIIAMAPLALASSVTSNIKMSVNVLNVPPQVTGMDFNYQRDGGVIPLKKYSLTADVYDDNGMSDIVYYKIIAMISQGEPSLADLINATSDGITAEVATIMPDGTVIVPNESDGWGVEVVSLPNAEQSGFSALVKFGSTAKADKNWYIALVAVDESGAAGYQVIGPFEVNQMITVFQLETPFQIVTGVKLKENTSVTIPVKIQYVSNSQVLVTAMASDLSGLIYNNVLYNGEDFRAVANFMGNRVTVGPTETTLGTIGKYSGELTITFTLTIESDDIVADIYEGVIVLNFIPQQS